ncbi:MAG: PstS family phosphate ABC transporter substrate-binding protein [Omnitrophica WOR_2 bacterium]
MNKNQRPTTIVSCLLLLSFLLSGCGSQAPAGSTVTISGAFALYPMVVRWGEEFKKVHPNVEFDISAGGAGKGMSDALGGAVDIGMVSRAINPEEEAKGAFWVPVTKDAVFVVVNNKNPVYEDIRTKGVTKETLIGIYITGAITTWGQVVGKPEVTDPIHIFTRSDACGAADALAKYLGNKKQEDLKGVGVFGDPGVLDAVVKDPLGIGYNNLNYAYDPASGLPAENAAIVSLDANGNGKADPDEVYDTKKQAIDAILTGKYPSPPARDLNLVTKGKPAGVTLAFIQWILADGQKFVNEVGYIPLTDAQLQSALQKLK